MTRPLARAAALALLAAAAGCATSSEGTPEAAIAASLQQYRHQSEAFADRRQTLVRERLAIAQEAQADTARTQIEVARILSVWRIARDSERLGLYEQVVGATREAGAAVETLEKLLADQREALDKAETRVEVHGDKLTAAAKALAALGDERKLSELASRYVKFLVKTREELKKLDDNGAKPGDRPPPQ